MVSDIGDSVRVAFAELIKDGMWKTMSGVIKGEYFITAVQEVDSNDVYVLIDYEQHINDVSQDQYEERTMELWEKFNHYKHWGV